MTTERVTDSGIILPPRQNTDTQWPCVQLTTDVTGLVFNVAINHETPEGHELFVELQKTVERAQLQLEGGDVPEPIELVSAHDGTSYRLTPNGIRHITAVCEAFAQHVDVSASNMKGQIHYRKRPDLVELNGGRPS